MATYKKGFKKQNTETVLLKVIIGIIISVFVFVAIAFVYETANQWKSYDNYTKITEYNGILEYTNGGDAALQDYVVYFYSTSCPNCQDVKTQVLRDGNKLNKDAPFFFIADTGTMSDESTNQAAFLTAIDKTTLSTPMLVVVANGQFYGAYVGSTEVVSTLDSIVAGTFDAFN